MDLARIERTPSDVRELRRIKHDMTLFWWKCADVMVLTFSILTEAPFRAFGKFVMLERIDKTLDVLHDVSFPFTDMPVGVEVGIALEI